MRREILKNVCPLIRLELSIDVIKIANFTIASNKDCLTVKRK